MEQATVVAILGILAALGAVAGGAAGVLMHVKRRQVTAAVVERRRRDLLAAEYAEILREFRMALEREMELHRSVLGPDWTEEKAATFRRQSDIVGQYRVKARDAGAELREPFDWFGPIAAEFEATVILAANRYAALLMARRAGQAEREASLQGIADSFAEVDEPRKVLGLTAAGLKPMTEEEMENQSEMGL